MSIVLPALKALVNSALAVELGTLLICLSTSALWIESVVLAVVASSISPSSLPTDNAPSR